MKLPTKDREEAIRVLQREPMTEYFKIVLKQTPALTEAIHSFTAAQTRYLEPGSVVPEGVKDKMARDAGRIFARDPRILRQLALESPAIKAKLSELEEAIKKAAAQKE